MDRKVWTPVDHPIYAVEPTQKDKKATKYNKDLYLAIGPALRNGKDMRKGANFALSSSRIAGLRIDSFKPNDEGTLAT